MKKIITSIAVLFGALSLSSCESWLDVTASNEIREEDHLSTEIGYQQVVVGCYISMTSNDLYGSAFSYVAPERMTDVYQKMVTGSSDPSYYLQKHNFTSKYSTGLIDAGWLKAYNVITNANNALKQIDDDRAMFEPINYATIKGELLAIRAYCHFDILRLFGASNLGGRPDKMSEYTAPYVTGVNKDITEQATYAEYLANLKKDLTEAIELLKDDPITGVHEESYYGKVNEDGFYNKRKQRLNNFAVRELLARVYMWEGTTEARAEALSITQDLIADIESSSYLSWATDESLNSDYVMSTEHVFSLEVSDLLTKTADYFNIGFIGEDPDALYVMDEILADSVYEFSTSTVGVTDYRYTKLISYNSDKHLYMVKKLYQPNSSYDHKDLVPMMRMSEVYYMAAECLSDSDPAAAVSMLNDMRRRRGITEDITATDIDTFNQELKKEYRKEFMGEGVLFYFYKRTGVETFINYKTSEGEDIVMDDSRYMLPFPYNEIQAGRVQN